MSASLFAPTEMIGHAAGELGETFLELLRSYSLSVGFDLIANLLDARLDVGLLAGAFDDRACRSCRP